MPSGVFKPYAGVATAILVFTKGGETTNVWYYDMESDGRSLDDKRNELRLPDGERDYGDLHEIIKAYHARHTEAQTDRKAQHFFVPRVEIANNDYDLSINKYKEEVYEEVVYDKPSVILETLFQLEKTIIEEIEGLKEVLL